MENDVSMNSVLGLYVEVAKKAADGGGTDFPRSILCHVLRRRTDKGTTLTAQILEDVLKNNSLPTPAAQANNFILLLGRSVLSQGSSFQISPPKYNIYGHLGLRIGPSESKDLLLILTDLEQEKIITVEYLEGATSGGRKIPLSVSLTLAGWKKYEFLQLSVKDSRKAFVAMEFINSEKTAENYFFQTTLLNNFLIPTLKEIKYDLANPLSTDPTAGNIHSRLEVEIRKARFVVAELSHHNNGAYWEAGFARGLGKPVVYMYNKTIGNSAKPHFDVGSDHCIFWKEEEPQKAADDLKAVILATLFWEAG
jgi:hypothetical protein